MNDCDNAIKVMNCTYPIHELLAEYLITNELGETVLDFERIVPIPVYLQDPPAELLDAKPQSRSGDDLTQADLKAINEYHRRHRDRLNALDEWLKARWGFDGCVEDCYVNDLFVEFSTDCSPAKGIVSELAKLSGHVLRLTYLSNSMIGEFVAYPDGQTRNLEFEDLDEAPKWLKDEMGFDEEDPS